MRRCPQRKLTPRPTRCGKRWAWPALPLASMSCLQIWCVAPSWWMTGTPRRAWICRSQDKLLLKGTVGRVHSWVWPENDPRPSIVKIEGAKWQLDGVDEPGVYPIGPVAKTWFLVTRSGSLPSWKSIGRRCLSHLLMLWQRIQVRGRLCRPCSWTWTLEKNVDITFGAVAASRVRSREDALILRPFPLWLFQRGTGEGPKLLLQTLRGEDIDWGAFREGRMPFATCQTCQQVRNMDGFGYEQWDKIRANLPGMCMQCKHGKSGPCKRKLESGTVKYVCGKCKINKVEDAYPRAQLKQRNEVKPTCLTCCKAVDRLKCGQCEKVKPVEEFEAMMVTLPHTMNACKQCQEEIKKNTNRLRTGWFTCRGCKTVLPEIAAPPDHLGQHRRCLNCASRNTRQKDEQTCRNKACKRKFVEKQVSGQPRKRYCPACRHKGGWSWSRTWEDWLQCFTQPKEQAAKGQKTEVE